MKYSVFLLLFLLSCGSNPGENEQPEGEKSPITESLTKNFDDYYQNFDLIIEVLNSKGLLSDDKDGFSGAIRYLYSTEIVQYEMSESNKNQLQFIDNIGDLPLLFSCCSEYTLEQNLTENQVEFFEEFDKSSSAGAIDHVKISEILDEMSQEEFESNSVRETALILISHELIRNHFLY